MVISQQKVALKHHPGWAVQYDKLELEQLHLLPPDGMVHIVFQLKKFLEPATVHEDCKLSSVAIFFTLFDCPLECCSLPNIGMH